MSKSKMANRYSPEVRARAVRMVFEHQGSYETQAGAIAAIAPKICNDPLETCSCYKEENSNEYDHGREHQTLDSEAQSSAYYRDHSG
jgi:transposase-like protein